MLNLGRGMSPANIIDKTVKFFDFRYALPSEFTVTRSDAVACATHRDADGTLVLSQAGKPRIDHTREGLPLGILCENIRQNKLALYNASPADTTGISQVSGSATLSAVADLSALNAQGLDQIGNGNVIKISNSAHATVSTIEFSTPFGSTNAHSFSLWARVSGGNAATITRTGTSPQNVTITDDGYKRYKLENITGHATGDKIQMSIPAGVDVYFLLHQLEEGSFASSEIVTSGSAATRQGDRVRVQNLSTHHWFQSTQGYMVARYRPYVLGLDTEQYIFYASDNSTSNSIGMRIGKGTDKDIILNFRKAGTSTAPASIDILHIPQAVHTAGMAWRSDKMVSQMGGVYKSTTPTNDFPTDLADLAIGARNGMNESLWGWVEWVEIGTVFKEQGALTSRMYKPNDLLVMAGGQTLASGYFSSQEKSTAVGRDNFTQTLSQLSVHTNNLLADGTVSSAAISKTSDAVNYWWDLSSHSRGTALVSFYTKVKNLGFTPNVVLWAQGENDSGAIGVTTTRAQYKEALRETFLDIRKTLGSVRFLIQMIGRRGSSSYTNVANEGIQMIREVQQELAAEYPQWILLGAEIYDLALHDNLNLKDDGYITAANRNARVLCDETGAFGPQLVSANRNGTSVLVILSHDEGADFNPSSDISGFYYSGGSSAITITDAVRVSGDMIDLTLASVPSGGVEVLYYGYDGMVGLDLDKVVKDNTAYQMPLRATKVVVNVVG